MSDNTAKRESDMELEDSGVHAVEFAKLPPPNKQEKFTGERYLPGIKGEIELEHLHRYLYAVRLVKDLVVLDAACGDGYGSFILASVAKSVIGVDIDEACIKRAEGRYVAPNIGFKAGRCESLPISDSSVDVVVSFETLEHISDQESFLREIRRVLKPGGMLIISSPDVQSYNESRNEPNQFHKRELSRREFQELLKRNFANVELAGQRISFASGIFGGGFTGKPLILSSVPGIVNEVDELPNSPYLIGICSDRELPKFSDSIFEGTVNPYILSALEGGIAERDNELQIQRKKTEQAVSDREHLLREIEAGNRHCERLRLESVALKNRVADLHDELTQRNELVKRSGAIQSRLTKVYGALTGKIYGVMKHLPVGRFAWVLESSEIERSGLFDKEFYLSRNSDVRDSGMDPIVHYLKFGGREGRAPSEVFDGAGYLNRYPDVAEAGVNPLLHFIRCGRKEGRNPMPWFDAEFYTKWNPQAKNHPLGAFGDFLENFYPTPKLVLNPGDASLKVRELNIEVGNSSSLVGVEDRNPTISIVIPVHNKLAYTLRSVLSVVRAGAKVPFEVIVVDDRSDDDTSTILPCISRIQYLRQDENRGFIATCNAGAKAARGEYIVFLNNDTHVLPNWLDELYETFKTHPEAGLVGSQLLYPGGRLQEAGGIIWKDGSGWNYGRNGDRDHPDFNFARSVDYCSGASIMVPTQLFQSLGGFDTYYSPAYYEDTDFAFKVRAKGRDVIYQPLSKVVHFEGVSSGTSTGSGVKAYQVQNGVKFYERWKNIISTHRPNAERPDLECVRKKQSRALFFDATTPTPDRDGGSLIAFYWMKMLGELGYQVTFIPEDNLGYDPYYTPMLQREGVRCLYYPHYSNIEQIISSNPGEIELVVVFRYMVGKNVLPLIKKYQPQAKVVFHNIDLHYLRIQRQAELENSSALVAEAAKVKVDELKVHGAVDLVCTHSEFEKNEILRHLPNAHIEISPLIHDCHPSSLGFKEREDFCFLGGFGHPPNVDAVLYFVNEVMPILRKAKTGARFLIVGANPPPSVLALECEDVKVLGHVRQLDETFGKVKLSVAPIRYGAGVKNKVGLSMGYGVPVVATTIAAEGMGLISNEEVLIGNTPQELSDMVLKLYTDEALWAKLSENGLKLADRSFSLNSNRRLLASQLKGLGLRVE